MGYRERVFEVEIAHEARVFSGVDDRVVKREPVALESVDVPVVEELLEAAQVLRGRARGEVFQVVRADNSVVVNERLNAGIAFGLVAERRQGVMCCAAEARQRLLATGHCGY